MAAHPALVDTTAAPDSPRLSTRMLEIFARLDYILLAAVAALVGFGLWIVGTITRDDIRGDPSFFLSRQALAAAAGAVVMAVLAGVNPDILRRLRMPFSAATIALLIVVLLTPEVRGTHRWIEVGSFNFQPSEFVKIMLAVVLAAFVANRAAAGVDFSTAAGAILLAVPPIVLVFV